MNPFDLMTLSKSKSTRQANSALQRISDNNIHLPLPDEQENPEDIHFSMNNMLSRSISICPQQPNLFFANLTLERNKSKGNTKEEPKLSTPKLSHQNGISLDPCISININQETTVVKKEKSSLWNDIAEEVKVAHREKEKEEECVTDLKEFKNVGGVMSLLKKLFTRENVDRTKLSKEEKMILAAIVERKYDEKVDASKPNDILVEQVMAIIDRESKKRPEENYKYVFKRVIKSMREKFKQQSETKSKTKKKNSEKAFYEHYFKENIQKHKHPIERYYHPRNSNSKNSNFHKTINTEYIKAISESKAFVEDFMLEMDLLVEESKKIIDLKLRGLGTKFEEIFEKKGQSGVKDIVEYITTNKKCKLPWTIKEVEESIVVVKKLFNERLNHE